MKRHMPLVKQARRVPWHVQLEGAPAAKKGFFDINSVQLTILVATNTITPFVNRHRELVELGLINAYNIYLYFGVYRESWRDLSFVFAAQMFGAGKTRLGNEFISQTKNLIAHNKGVYKRYYCNYADNVLLELVAILEQFSSAAI